VLAPEPPVNDDARAGLRPRDFKGAEQGRELDDLALGLGLYLGREVLEVANQGLIHFERLVEALELSQADGRVRRGGARRCDLPRAQELGERRVPEALFKKLYTFIKKDARLLLSRRLRIARGRVCRIRGIGSARR
jgi:hypothetical protein